MNPLPPNADELVSAYLDGEAAPDEVVAVESSPELMARVELMRAAAGLVAQPVTPTDQKEVHIAAALGAFDELFGTGGADTSVTSVASAASLEDQAPPRLQAVPTPPSEPSPTAKLSPGATRDESASTVVRSFDDAKAKRRPRRMNIGVIAAAIAAVVLIAALGVLSFGRPSGDDTAASTAADTANTAEVSRSASDSSDAASDDAATESASAMDEEEEAMEDASSEQAQLSEVAPAAAPTAVPSQGLAADAADDEAASEPDVAADALEAEADDEAADEEPTLSFRGDQPLPFFFGEFETSEALDATLESLTASEIAERQAGVGQGIFTRCQNEIPELQVNETATLIGEASVLDIGIRELHATTTEDGTIIYVVDPQDCSVTHTLP